jgi:cytochrome c-type biogenesis protein CcmH/NrfG
MAERTQVLKGYIKTSNMYLIAIVTLSIGFLGGVLYTSHRMASDAPVPQNMMAPQNMPAPRAMPGTPPSAKAPLTQAQSDTLAVLEQATKTNPDNVQAWTQLGHLNSDLDRYEEAIDAYKKSLALDPNRPDVWTDMGVMYRRSGKPKKAIESFDRALSLNSRHETALYNKGVVLMHDLNDLDGAMAAWKALVKINPDAQTSDGRRISDMISGMNNQ